MPSRHFPAAVITLVLWLAGVPLLGSSHDKQPRPAEPEERILVGPLG